MRILTLSSSTHGRLLQRSIHNRFHNKTLKLVGKRSSATTAVAAESSFLSRRIPNIWSSPFQWYSHRLDTHPIITKCTSAGIIASTGNLLAQSIQHHQQNKEKEESSFEIDWSAMGRFCFLNVAYVAPVLHHWYQYVNRAFPGCTVQAVATRVFWDEFVFTPIYLPVFMGGLWTLEGTSWERVKHMVVKEMPSIVKAEWALWVPTMALTFRYAPVKYQVLVINLVGVIWQTYLSLVANQAHDHHDDCDLKNHHHQQQQQQQLEIHKPHHHHQPSLLLPQGMEKKVVAPAVSVAAAATTAANVPTTTAWRSH